MHLGRIHAGERVGILVARRTARRQNRARVQRRFGIANIGAVFFVAIIVSVKAIRD